MEDKKEELRLLKKYFEGRVKSTKEIIQTLELVNTDTSYFEGKKDAFNYCIDLIRIFLGEEVEIK